MQCGGYDLGTAADLGHHRHIRLQADQGSERPSDQGLVIGQQDADDRTGGRVG